MGDNKNFVKDITNIEEDFAQVVYRHCFKSRTCRLY